VDKKISFPSLIGMILVAAFILSSCTAATQTVAPITQEASPSPLIQAGSGSESATNTPAVVASAAPIATDTLAPTLAATEAATSTPQMAAQVIPTLNAYCRKGPGTDYHPITFLMKGTTYNVIGRDSLDSWWLIEAPGNVNCWVIDTQVNKQGAVGQVSIVQGQSLPGTTAKFVSSYVCDPTLQTLGVSLNWAAVANVTGYRIYRNGKQLANIEPTASSFHDDAPLGVDLVYELEAFNDYGVGPRISTSVPACE
jgi:hypothetical protein